MGSLVGPSMGHMGNFITSACGYLQSLSRNYLTSGGYTKVFGLRIWVFILFLCGK